MFITVFLPFVGVGVGIVVPWLKQQLDSKFTGDKYVTKQFSMSRYKLIYGGPEYLIHFKYSEFLNITYITMMYGIGIPLLFPIAALALFNAYISERILLAYAVRLPPAMDNVLTKNAMSMVKMAPLFLLCNGFWMVDNKQIFRNFTQLVRNDL